MYKTSNYSISYSSQQSIAASFPVLMRKVFIWMTLALAVTGITAYGISQSPELTYTIVSNQLLFWGLLIGEFGLVLWMSAGINKMSLQTATLLFLLYSVLNGVTMSVIFLAYTMSSIASVFFITAGTFGAMSLFGYITKTDLTSMGKLLIMALIGLIIATIVNLFLHSTGLQMICSYAGVLIFTGLTAYDTQKIKHMLANADDYDETAQKYAVLGALTLYLDFINLFLYLLRIFGRRK
ncbi:MAG: Bax inhibitor-1/YccA family protein [Bacteroidaceae bacterium]|nr:Bax inhibitor-1/YccA family protein [Bacteroidaceae bacterium]